MARLWTLSLIDKRKCHKELDTYRGCDINMDFCIYIIEYNLIEEAEEKYSYIENKIIPILRVNEAFYVREFFLKQLADLSRECFKYKLFNLVYLEFNK